MQYWNQLDNLRLLLLIHHSMINYYGLVKYTESSGIPTKTGTRFGGNFFLPSQLVISTIWSKVYRFLFFATFLTRVLSFFPIFQRSLSFLLSLHFFLINLIERTICSLNQACIFSNKFKLIFCLCFWLNPKFYR